MVVADIHVSICHLQLIFMQEYFKSFQSSLGNSSGMGAQGPGLPPPLFLAPIRSSLETNVWKHLRSLNVVWLQNVSGSELAICF